MKIEVFLWKRAVHKFLRPTFLSYVTYMRTHIHKHIITKLLKMDSAMVQNGYISDEISKSNFFTIIFPLLTLKLDRKFKFKVIIRFTPKNYATLVCTLFWFCAFPWKLFDCSFFNGSPCVRRQSFFYILDMFCESFQAFYTWAGSKKDLLDSLKGFMVKD